MHNIEHSNSSYKLRPLSPHLSIYKPQLTSTLSIFHRITGSVLTCVLLGSILLFKLYSYFGSYACLSYGYDYLSDNLEWAFSTVMFMLLLSFFYHTCNGIRHLLWDIGYGLDLRSIYFSGYLVVITSFVLAITTWILPALI